MKPRFSTYLIICLAFSSCAYFNTFHNTKKFFKEAEKERKNRQGEEPTPTELKKYDQTIEKASKILEVYPDSKYVDDAVLILGECFYYKGDYVKAQRKFEELTTFFSESEYFDKAKLWLAKTNIQTQEYFAARFILEDLITAQDVKREIREEAQLLLGDIQFGQESYALAKEEYRKTAKNAKDKEIRARAYFRLGESQLQTGDHHDAVSSFQNAMKDSPNKQFRFEAELNYGRALKLSGKYKEASQICHGLLEEESFKEKHGVVKLEIADCVYREGKALYKELKDADLKYLGKVEKAIDEYKKITLEYKRTEVAANAYYQMAKIYEKDFGDFAASKEYYEKVKFEDSKSEWVPEATKKAGDLADLIRLKNLVKKSQNKQLGESNGTYQHFSDLEMLLLKHGVHPELRFMKRQKKRGSHSASSQKQTNGVSKPAEEDDLDTFITNKLQLAETYLFQFGQVDSALNEYDEIIDNFPNHSGTAKALFTSAVIYENEFHNKSKTDSLLYVLIERFPDSIQAQEARKILGILPKLDENRLAFELYKVAERSLFSQGDSRKALRDFRKVADDYPETDYAPKALYAIGWLHEHQFFDNEKAIATYQELLDKYPNSAYAETVDKKLRLLQKPEDKPPPQAEAVADTAKPNIAQPEKQADKPDEQTETTLHDDKSDEEKRILQQREEELKDEPKEKPTP
ncbi:tetratricopeptide repeat protein [candidate division KSB1 bacterium]|nr:tetratricopeptide repeat protein [candidate division KSB1 bacterium]